MAKKLTLAQMHQIADGCTIDFAGVLTTFAATDETGYLGFGGSLNPATLLHAYRCGVFPWFNEGEPVCWWSPSPRCVMVPERFVPSKSLVRRAKKQAWTLTTNVAFDQVIQACSAPRAYTADTWITHKMKHAYQQLHRLGAAVSVEVWQNQPQRSALIGGLYGVNIGAVFCGESMFYKTTDASKVAFWGLMAWCQQQGIQLVDCQLKNAHLMSLGAQLLPRHEFLGQLALLVSMPSDGLGGQRQQMSSAQLAQR